MKVIALTGRAGSGKDTAALGIQLIVGARDMETKKPINLDDYFNTPWLTGPNQLKDWPILKFSYPVYQIAAILTGHNPLKPEDLMTSSFKEYEWEVGLEGTKMTGRQILQLAGTEAGRHVFGESLWLKLMDHRLKALRRAGCQGVLVTDCRFRNEGDFLHTDYNATIIRMIGRHQGLEQTHASESELEQIKPDGYLHNHLDYLHLMNQLQEICDDLKISNHQYKWK